MRPLLSICALALAACSPTPTNEPVSAPPAVTEPPASPPAATSTGAASAVPAHGATLFAADELVIDLEGNLYAGQCTFEAGQSAILRIDSRGVLDRIAGTGNRGFGEDGAPALETDIDCPAGLAFGPDGIFYFSDHGNNRVRRLERDGTVRTVAGSGPAGVGQGSFGGDGGPATSATLQEPWGIAFDSKGNLYIADRDNDRIRRVDTDGTISTVAGTGVRGYGGDGGAAIKAQLCGPQGVVVDAADDLYIADDCNDRIRRVDARGQITTFAGTGSGGNTGDGGPATAAQIDGPDGLAFDRDGNLFVATNPGLTIRRIAREGMITTIAGTGTSGAPAEGEPAIRSSFPELYGLAFDAAGNLFVADGQTAIWRIDAAGILTRFAGAPPSP